ncbi:hypothetical protein AVEN_205877-1 [Araneus ventricosus]|uniref:Uncharacterized protein n=1 Tax=Araneus ventricosus TaxID=182803 RepID=A0A4Y2IU56_ARAVE|nr:hypothetical protein AVEN_205877-1 [Araneus ventricosus]
MDGKPLWCGSFVSVLPTEVSPSSSEGCSKLRSPSQNCPRVASKRDVNVTKLNYAADQMEDVCSWASDLISPRRTYTTEFCWIWISSLKPSSP